MPVLSAARRAVHRVWHAFDGLAGDTMWSAGHDGIALVATIVSFELIHRSLPLPVYGSYVGLYGLLGAVGALTFSGVGLAALQRLLGERDDPHETLRSFLSLVIIGASLMSLVAIGVALQFIRLSAAAVVLVVAAELLGIGTIYVCSALVQAASGFPAAVRIRLGIVAIRLTAVVGLALTDRLTIANLGLVLLIGFALYTAYLQTVHLPRHGYRVSYGRPSGQSLRSSGVFSAPMAAGKIQTDADKFFLNVYDFRSDAALYGAAYRVLMLGLMPLAAMDTAAFQRFLPRDEPGSRTHWRRAVRLAAVMVVLSTLVAIALYLILPYLHFLVADEYRGAFDIIPWLLPLVPLISTSGSSLNGLLGLGLGDRRMMVSIVSSVVSVTCYLVLIPRYSWKGAVGATYISEIFLAALGWTTLWYYQNKADKAALAAEQPPAVTSA